MKNYYRIRTDVSKDQVVRAKLSQAVDFLEILSLKIRQEDTYRLHVSNYGVIVGRVLANDAFGIPNAKVSVFIPLEDDDASRSEITNLYPYADIQTKDEDNRRYNLLPDYSNDICYRVVGSFPNKRLVLDNNTEIEIFEKYWKYTTVTNKSGDYMIFGVPRGNHQVHVDVDLSDIGVLSQKPRDFMYKGYSITQFDNSSQFKESTNLDNLSQLLSQTSSVYVYPFWGDTDVEEVAITRCDLQVQYKFEPTCVFFGSIVSDNFSNNIGDKCNPSKYVGFNRNLVAGEGTIEMIRKTQDGLVEEFQIQGNRLIDGDGVWCYQIPMNLDYVGTDEFGNIVPTDDPNKGIPTRTSVRFRISMQETSNDGIARHRAKYLVPNVQPLVKESTGVEIRKPNEFVQCFEFGSATLDEYFRDLYWNKVYTVKNYIPRIQLGRSKNTQRYSAIRTVNSSNNLNPFPFNHARFRLFFAYRVLCVLMQVMIAIICGINAFTSFLAGLCLDLKFVKICPFRWTCKLLPCISLSGGLTEDDDNNIEYFPCCQSDACMKCSESPCVKETSMGVLMDKVQQSLAQEYDTVNLDFYNDWINGCLYLPLWFWKKTKKKKFLFGLFSRKAINRYCNCDSNYRKLKITESCSLHTNDNYIATDSDSGTKYHYQYPDNDINIGHGIIKEVENRDGLKIYYYVPGVPRTNDYRDTTAETVPYVRLYSTDIVLLGSLNECDLDNLPRPFINLPSTTANIPYISTIKDDATDSDFEYDGTVDDKGTVEVTGMDWLGKVNDGLFMDLTCLKVRTKPKTCINLDRMSELGVTLDARYFDAISSGDVLKYDNERPSDGMITRYELMDNETRAMFASLNHNGLQEKVRNPNTGYDTYKLLYIYPTDFDGHLSRYAPSYTSKLKVRTYDNQDFAYVDYIFGITDENTKRHFYSRGRGNQMPALNNSFFFYFGLNEGNTSIDKFNNMFYSECFKNVKYPFSMTYVTTPAKWCKEYDNMKHKLKASEAEGKAELKTDYATIDVTLKGITVPYSYKLTSEFDLELVEESDMYATTLKFGYDIDEFGEYMEDKYGALKYSQTNELFTYEVDGEEYVYLLDNGTYYLEVTDFNGNSITQTITISQSQIVPNITVYGLGDKYYEDITNEDDICNKAGNYGEIIITSISIDGKNHIITNFVKHKENGVDGYKLTCEFEGNVEEVFLQIEPAFRDEESGELIDVAFEDCICTKGEYAPQINDKNELVFKIWVPGDYKITVTQYCDVELNDNTASETVNVPNGEPFLTYINETPLRFIVGKNTEINQNTYNKNFYNRVADTTIATTNSTNGWFNVHDEKFYVFEGVENESDMSVWEDYIEVGYLSGDNDLYSDIDLTTKLDVIDYKMQCLTNMCNMTYITDTDDKSLSYKTSGGKSPILLRGLYPQYALFNDNTRDDNQVMNYLFDSDARVTCPYRSANIVGFNYTQYDQDFNCWTRVNDTSPRFNNLFADTNYIGNYFAAYTSNAGCEYDGEDWTRNADLIYQSNPQDSCSYAPEIAPGSSSIGDIDTNFGDALGNAQYNSYFRALTIDRRIDYSYFVIMPYNETNAVIGLEDNGWKNGRLVGFQYNGVEMCYDNSYNIVGTANATIDDDNNITYNYNENTYEYYLPKLLTSMELVESVDEEGNPVYDTQESPSCFSGGEKLEIHYTSDITNKRLYECSWRCGKTYDLRDRFWAEGKPANTEPIDDKIYFNEYTDFPNVNGAFDLENYPTVRGLDVYNFPFSSNYSYSATSCDYNGNLEFMDIGGTEYEYEYILEGEGTTSFNLNGNNGITLNNGTLEEAAANNNGNVMFSPYTNPLGGTDGTFVITAVDLSFKIPDDTTNTTHRNFVYMPFYGMFNVDDNPFKTIQTMPLNGDIWEMPTAVCDLVSRNGGQLRGGDTESTSSDFSSQIRIDSDRPIPNDIFRFNKNRCRYDNGGILYSDDSLARSLTYRIKRTELRNYDFMSVTYFRRYMNNEYDNLSKDLMTFNLGTLIDVRPFEMTCVLSIDKSMSDEVEIEVPSGEESGGTTTETETVEIERQVTTFHIKLPSSGDTNYNQSFTDPTKMSAAIRYLGKVAADSNISISDDGSELIIEIIWSGALSGVKVGQNIDYVAHLFIKMPNGLIFRILVDLTKATSE